MAETTERQKQTKGACMFCSRQFARGGMSRHQLACPARAKAIEEADCRGGTPTNLYTLQVRDRYNGDFWLYLEMCGEAKLQALDRYLRAIWLECCGHLSQFTTDGWGGTAVGMSRTADSVFPRGFELTHIYDYGTSSYTLIRPTAIRKGIPLTKHPIFLMARNQMPETRCIECGEPAELLCMECMIEDDEWGTLCRAHAENHPHEDYGEPIKIVNSPRLGMCGYDGPAEPPY